MARPLPGHAASAEREPPLPPCRAPVAGVGRAHRRRACLASAVGARPVVDQAGAAAISVNYNDEQTTLTPEKCMAMLLKSMQQIAEKDKLWTILISLTYLREWRKRAPFRGL